MMYEQLESRRFLSAVVKLSGGDDPLGQPSIKLSRSGTLFVSGSTAKESITIGTRTNGRIAVDFVRKGETTTVYTANFKASDVERLNVSAGAGNDVIVVNVDVSGHSDLRGGRGNDSITTHGRHTYISGDAGDDTLISDAPVFQQQQYSMADTGQTLPKVPAIQATYNVLYDSRGRDTFLSRGGEDRIIGGGGYDRFMPLEAGLAISHDGLKAIPQWSDVQFADSRVDLTDVRRIENEPTGKDAIRVNFSSLEEQTFRVYSE